MLKQDPNLPDEVAKKPLHFFWLTDYSGSMAGKKISTLNQAIREAIPEVRKAVSAHPQTQIFMRAIKFSATASWHVGPQPTKLENFFWPELTCDSATSTAKAIRLLSSEFRTSKMPRQGYPPVCILISDGFCTDTIEEYDAAISEFMSLPWGGKSVRLSIVIGNEAEYDEKQLLKFVSHPKIGVLKAHTPEALVQYIIWASITASLSSSQSKSERGGNISQNVALPPPPPEPKFSKNTDVF